MKLLDGSGGSTKGMGIFHAWKTAVMNHGFEPDIITGISVSALMAVPFAIGKYDQLEELWDNFNLSYIYDPEPVNQKGRPKLKAVFRLISGCPGLSTMKPMEEMIRGIVSEQDYLDYCKGDFPEVHTMSVDFKSGKRVFTNMKSLNDYELFIKFSLASASIPIASDPILINNMILFDGGTRDHDITHWALENFNIKEAFSVWSRPEDYDISDEDWEADNAAIVLGRTLDIMQVENSKSDQEKMFSLSDDNKVNLKTVFLPKVLNSVFDVDRNRLNLLKEVAIKLTDNEFSG